VRIFENALSNGRGLRRVSSFAAYSKLGEGLCPIDNPQPLIQLRLASKLARLHILLPKEKG
jgi:hypothetical protein